MNNYNYLRNRLVTMLKTREPDVYYESVPLTTASRWRGYYLGLVMLMLLLTNFLATSQTAATYVFSQQNGTYTETSAGATALTAVRADTFMSAAQNIGFNFVYEGTTYTQFKMSSNGFISFGISGTDSFTTNSLANLNVAASRPVIAPLWDDLDGAGPANSVAAYEVTGSAPNRVLTVEWRNWEWNWQANTAVISFQVKLYETTNVIEFVYRSEAGSYNAGSTGGASIGIGSGTLSGAGSYLFLTSVTAPAVSSTTFTTDIANKPATGTVYRFTPPTCFSATNLTLSNISMTGADLSWTAPVSGVPTGYEYTVSTSATPPASGTAVTGTSVTGHSGLLSGTQYYLHVRTHCGGTDFSGWTTKSFYTLCDVPSAATGISFSAVSATATTVGFTAPAQTPFGYVIFRSTSATPPVLANGTIYTVNQTTAVSSLTSGGNTYFCIYNGTAVTGTATSLTSNTRYYYYVFSRNGLTAAECASGPIYSTTALTGNQITAPAAPGTVTAVPTMSGANLSWVAAAAGGSAVPISYVVEVYTSSAYTTHVGSSPYAVGTSLNAVINGLSQGTTYYYRIKSNNGSDSSYTTGSFTTLIYGQIGIGTSTSSNFPITSNYGYNYSQQIYTKAQFEAISNPGEKYINKIRFYYVGTSSSGGESNVSANFNTWKIYLGNTAKTAFSGNTDWIPVGQLQEVYAGVIPNPLVPGWVELILTTPFEWNQTGNIVVAVNEEVAGFGTLSYWRGFTSGTGAGIYYRSDTAPTTTLPTTPPTANGTTSTINQVQFTLSTSPITCFEPTALTVSALTSNSAEFTWGPPSTGTTPTGYEYAVTTSATPPGSGYALSGSTFLVNTGNTLTTNTTYYVHVRSVCGAGNYSEWISKNFYTGYCVPTGNNTSYQITNIATTGATTNMTSTSSGGAGYVDYSASRSVSHYAGGNFGISITTNSTTSTFYHYVWVDWNNNLSFTDANEAVIATSSYVNLYNGTIAIPAGTPLGSYKMRVAISFSGAITACGTTSGEYEDYTLTVVAPPVCMTPTTPTASNITIGSAVLSWTSTASLFDIKYGAPGFNVATEGTLQTAVSNSYLLPGLAHSTAYQYYVRTNCGVDGVSDWAGPFSFTTAIPGQIGTGTATSSNFPILSNYVYNYSQQIYLSSELHAVLEPGSTYITKIRFKQVSLGTQSTYNNWTVYMANTAKTTFATASDWVPYSSLDQVFSGVLTFATNSWVEITLDTPFIWDGISNLIVAVDENTAGYSSSSFAAFNSGTDRGILYYSDSINPDPVSPPTSGDYFIKSTTIAQAQFVATALPTCFAPRTLAINLTGATSATLSWNAPLMGTTAGYEYVLSTSATVPTGPGTAVSGTSVNVSDLAGGATYYLHVRNVCEAGVEYSTWSTSSAATMPLVTAVPWFEGFETASLPVQWSQIDMQVGNFTGMGGNPGNAIAGNLYYDDWYEEGTTLLVAATPNLGIIAAGHKFTFDYKVANYASPYNPPAVGSGNIVVQVSTNFGATYTTIETIPNNAVAGWQYKEYDLTPYAGGYVKFRIISNYNSGDYNVGFDNFRIAMPCTGIPNGGSIAPAVQSICAGYPSATLAVTGFSNEPGVSLQWQTNTGSGWTDIVGITTASYLPANYAGGVIQYRVKVTCATSGEISYSSVSEINDNPQALPFTTDFSSISSLTGWSQNGWFVGSARGAVGNSGDNAYAALTSTTAVNLTSGNYGPVQASHAVSFDYQVTNNASPYAASAVNAASITVSVSTNCGATYTVLETFSNDATAGYKRKVIPLGLYAGQNVLVRITAQRVGTTSVDVSIDNFAINTPPPAITSIAPIAVCGRGDVVTVTGNYFVNITSVTIDGNSIPFTPIDLHNLSFVVPVSLTAGTYPITVTSALGSSTSTSVLLIKDYPVVSPIQGPSSEVCGGSTLLLSNLTGGGTWSSLDTAIATVSGGTVAGVAAGSTTISYTVVNNDCSTTVTYPVIVKEPVVVNSFTTIQNAVAGATATYTVNATGNDLTYQWYITDFSDVYPIDNSFTIAGESFSGGNSATLVISNATVELNGLELYCEVSGASSCAMVTTMPNSLIFVGDTGIGQDPESVALCNGGSTTFTVVRAGEDDPEDVTYSWEYDVNGTDNWLPVTAVSVAGLSFTGFDTDVLSVNDITIAHNGFRFKATVSGPANIAVSNPATLNIYASVAVSTVTDKEVCYSGGTVVFSATATGDFTGYQWQYSANGSAWDAVVNNTPAGATYSGATTGNLSVTTTASTPASGTHYYRMIALANAACTDGISNTAQLHLSSPVITTLPTAQSVYGGYPATFTVVSSDAGATYQWQYATSVNGTYANVINATPANITYSGTTSNSLTVTTAAAIAAGANHYYRVIVTVNGCSVATEGVQLTVNNYCVGATTNPASTGNMITSVVLRNTSVNTVYTNATGTTTSPAGHTVVMNTPFEYTQGHSGSVAISMGTNATQHSAVWIDFNRNGLFEADENIALSSTASGASSTVVYAFAIPFTATPGLTKIRVRGAADVAYTAGGACTTTPFGETEDYWIQILEAPVCDAAPVAGTIATPLTDYCQSGTAVLTATGYPQGVQGVTMQWHNASGPISGATLATYTTPMLTTTQTYFLRVTCTHTGLYSDTNSVTITITNPEITSVANGERCGVGTVALGATGSGDKISWYTASDLITKVGEGAVFQTPTLSSTTTFYAVAVSGEDLGSKTIGSGASTSNSSGTPYYHFWGGQKAQYIIRASELTAQGVTAGKLTSIAFDIATLGTSVNTFNGFNIAIGQTSQTAAVSNTAVAGLTTVYNKSAQTVTTGINTYAFTSPFIWDGVSNLVVQVVYSNNNEGGETSSGSVTVRTDTAAFTSTLAIYADNASAADILAATSDTGLGTNRSNTTSSTRPKMIFGRGTECKGTPVVVTATVTPPPSLVLSANSSSICAGTSSSPVMITAGAGDYNSFVWSPSVGVSGDAVSGFVFNPAMSTTYTLTATNAEGCANVITHPVTVYELPVVTVANPVQTVCSVDAPVALTVNSLNNTASTVLFTESFDAASSQFSLVNTSGTGTAVISTTYYSEGAGSVRFNTTATSANVSYAMNSNLNLTNYGSVQLTFSHMAIMEGPTTSYDYGRVEYSADGGATWVAFPTSSYAGSGTLFNSVVSFSTRSYADWITSFTSTSSLPSNSLWKTETINVPAAAMTSQFRIRFRYTTDSSTNYYGWMIDNVKINATPYASTVWAPITGLFTDAAGTNAYMGGGARTVYAKPASTTIYTVTSSNSAGCNASTTATVNVTPATVWYRDVDGDGFGNDAVTVMACSKPTGYVAVGGDCNDAVATIYPGAPEVCYDGIVQNCGTDGKAGCPVILTELLPGYCGVSLPLLHSTVTAAIPSTPVGTAVTGYKYEITNLNTGAVRELERDIRNFNLKMTDIYEYGTTYSVRVAVRINQEWQPYGTICNITTPNIPTTQLAASNCGATLTLLSSVINANTVTSVSMYEFRVVNVSNPSEVQTIQRTLNSFQMTMLTTYPAQYNTTYNVSVRVRTVIDGADVWSSYGAVCSVTTPLMPTTQIQLSQCEMIATSASQQISADNVAGATQYAFILRNASLGYEQEIIRSTRTFSLSMFTGLQSGTTYDVTVKVMTYNYWGAEGKACSVTTPGGVTARQMPVADKPSSSVVGGDFRIVGYPNPFSTSFGLDLQTSSSENLSLSVYDMTGRLLEVRDVRVDEVSGLQLGDRYPSGVYNVVAAQGSEIRTIRVVKR